MTRPRNTRVTVEHRTLAISGEERRRIREAFEQRERARLGLAPRAPVKPVRRGPASVPGGDVKAWLSKGYSVETARELAATTPSPFWKGGEVV